MLFPLPYRIGLEHTNQEIFRQNRDNTAVANATNQEDERHKHQSWLESTLAQTNAKKMVAVPSQETELPDPS
jgi:hypothetical protein